MKTVQEVTTGIQTLVAMVLEKNLGLTIAIENITLERPPQENMGEYAYPCFALAKLAKKNPAELAGELAQALSAEELDVIEKVEANGPYVNFYLARGVYTELVINQIMKEQNMYGSSKEGKHHRIMIEYSSPNTNKPQHVGHVRNNVLGFAMSVIVEKIGYEAVRINLVNDRGIHIMQSMLAYMKWGAGATPESAGEKSDHFVGNYYVKFSQENKKQLEEALEGDSQYEALQGRDKEIYKRAQARQTPLAKEAQALLQQWEAGDSDVVRMWEQMREWALGGLNQTYKDLEVFFDEEVFESQIYTEGKKAVERGLKLGVFERDETGRVIARLEDVGLPDITVLRSDGTSLYITQDIFLARHKFDKYNIDKSVYVTAIEQELHFRQLFAILKKLDYPFAKDDKLYHRSYGFVNLIDGRMKSREGRIVDADDVIADTVKLARKKAEDSKTTVDINDESVRMVGLGAIKYFMLSHESKTDITFDPDKALAFEGHTGPFIQYAHARAVKIAKKSAETLGKPPARGLDFGNATSDEEFALVKLLAAYPDKVNEAAHLYDPSVIATYVFHLARAFNTFYHKNPVLKVEPEVGLPRLMLVEATATVLKDGLGLLGIGAPDEM